MSATVKVAAASLAGVADAVVVAVAEYAASASIDAAFDAVEVV